MKFKALQENLRKAMRKRIDKGDLTGLKLAQQTGFEQAHISNFLNSKRSLSLEGMDKVLNVQHLSVLDLLDPSEINKRASITPPSKDEFEDVLMAEGPIAAGEPLIINENVKDILKFKKSFLRRLRPSVQGSRDEWRRYVLVKVDSRDGTSMYPRLMPGCIVLIDRHYNSLEPYRKNEQNMYAVKKDGGLTIKYVEMVGNSLVLRPHNQSWPIQVIPVQEGETYGDHIVGRICYVGVEV